MDFLLAPRPMALVVQGLVRGINLFRKTLMTTHPAMLDVLERELIHQILTLPATWASISPERMAARANEALDKLVESGLAEARLTCWLRLSIRRRWYEFWKPDIIESLQLRFRISGNYRAGLMNAIAKGMPRYWLRDGKLVGDMDLRVGEFDELHLTLQGELAQRDVREGRIAFFLQFASSTRVKPQIYLEEKTSNVGHFGNMPPMQAVAVARASAHAENTVHIHLSEYVSHLNHRARFSCNV